jgi:hypothetical protein
MGIPAGTAWAELDGDGDAWVARAGGMSAGWVASLYPVEDVLRSEWSPHAGSTRYVTRFREGRFQQDQDMVFAPDGIRVARSQRFDEGWKSWEDHYPGMERAEDPISAFYRIRSEPPDAGGELEMRVWSGRRAGLLVARTVGVETVGEARTLHVEVSTGYSSADVRDTLTLWLSDDAEHVPLAAVIHTRAGPVRLDLIQKSPP